MSAKIVQFDNGYKCYIGSNYVADKNGMLIADLYHTVNELSLKLSEMSDVQIWSLCKPIINAYEMAMKQTKNRMAEKLLSLFDLEAEFE